MTARSHTSASSYFTMGTLCVESLGRSNRSRGTPVFLAVFLLLPDKCGIWLTPADCVGGLQLHVLVVRDEDYQAAIQKLLESHFVSTVPHRNPPPEVMERLSDPQAVVAEINKGYRRLDLSSTTFNYPSRYSGRTEQVVLIPNSFAHLPLEPVDSTSSVINRRQIFPTNHYDVYGNLFYPLEQALVESLVKAAVDDDKDGDITSWESY